MNGVLKAVRPPDLTREQEYAMGEMVVMACAEAGFPDVRIVENRGDIESLGYYGVNGAPTWVLEQAGELVRVRLGLERYDEDDV